MSARRRKLPTLNRENAVVGIAAAAALCVMGAVSQRPAAAPVQSSTVVAAGDPAALDPAVVAEDLKLRNLLIGRWQADYHGVLTVENHEDGAASMRMEFDFVASFLYGKTLDLKLTWKVENRILTYLIHSGSPEANWKPFKRDFGEKVAYNFRKVGDDRVQLSRVDTPDEIVNWLRKSAPATDLKDSDVSVR